jgi:hypothetical protein
MVSNIRLTGKVAIKGIKSIPGNGVSVMARDKDEVDEIVRQIELAHGQTFDIKPVKMRDPTVTLFLQGTNYTTQGVKDEILSRQQGMSENSIEVKKIAGTKNGNSIVYIQTKPEAYDIIKRQGHNLYVGWLCARVKDALPTNQCYKCHRFGHNARDCENKVEGVKALRCCYCGGDHRPESCGQMREPECPNCTDWNKRNCVANNRKASQRNYVPLPTYRTDHSAKDTNCPYYVKAMNNARSLIDYGL